MIKKVNIAEIKPNEENPRFITDAKFKKLIKSIKAFPEMLETRPLVVDENMVVLGGNMRLKALKSAGVFEVPVHQVKGWTAEQKKEFIIKDNIGYGEWDWDIIANDWELDTLKDWGLDLPDFPELEPEAIEDDYEEPEDIQVDVVFGDLIEIGGHRLLCGDSTDPDQVARLMDGKKADLLLTDPPYGIDYGSMLKGKGDGKGGADKNGWKSYDSPDWDKNKPSKGVLIYFCEITSNQIIWGGNYFTDDLPPTMGWLVWDKGQRDFSLADGEMAWTSFNNALRIKEYSRALANKENKIHPTQKPIEIIKWCFDYAKRHSKNENNLILDPYLGSGSILVTSHQINKICYGIELDPKYCQLIIDRMHKLDPTLKIKINGKEYKNL